MRLERFLPFFKRIKDTEEVSVVEDVLGGTGAESLVRACTSNVIRARDVLEFSAEEGKNPSRLVFSKLASYKPDGWVFEFVARSRDDGKVEFVLIDSCDIASWKKVDRETAESWELRYSMASKIETVS